MSCVFCSIVSGDMPSQILHQDGEVIAFRDINPQAPTHILIVPRKHIASLNEIDDEALIEHMVSVARKLAQAEGIAEKGYRLVVNCGPEGAQAVPHLHMHLLGGRQLSDGMG